MPTTIHAIRAVAIPTLDQDRAAEFFASTLGFTKTMDAELQPGFRWIEMSPPGCDVAVAIVLATTIPVGVDTGIRFAATDAAAERDALRTKGIDVGDLLEWPGVPRMFHFRDVDGNTYYVSEAS
jgi:hypothetical protein